MTTEEPAVLQVYCRIEVVVGDPGAVTDLAVRQLREADIDWAAEPDTLEEAAAELGASLTVSLAAVVDPERLVAGIPGVEVRRGRWWAEQGPPSPHFQPGFGRDG
ncbi:hypothetical protein ACQP2F_20840 [Actinoplanes sp. CA-030573]|uniref:hypothetical protein n=1 Tax=Actinoplanes sp. CA-030573 TaxID=3239898 RepID=UPI003D8AB576